ncbi:MAG: ornithine cyclodeaminase family protein [Rhodospirillaceae bacterium]|nr:ornithine cyclodeaminase family protein [Rhodospirillaceae bacterium]
MLVIDAAEIGKALTPALVIEALREAFRAPIEVPVRHHHSIPRGPDELATLLLMPAWHKTGGYIGVKIASVFPLNAKRNAPSVEASYLLMAGDTGTPLAVMDGRAITLWRTAAASALAASYLAKPKAQRLLIVGAGALAPYLIKAHATARPIAEVEVWNRDVAKAETLAAQLDGSLKVTATPDLESATRRADIISAATLSTEPLIKGAWLQPGVHVDLVGGFTPKMREADDDCVRRASVFVDTRAGASKEAGDIVQPLQSGVIADQDIKGDLFDLCRGVHSGRAREDEITYFKSVGTAIEDLAAAVLVCSRVKG